VVPMDNDRLALEHAIRRLDKLRMPPARPKKKDGRPRTWIGRDGYLFLLCVNSIKKELAENQRQRQRRDKLGLDLPRAARRVSFAEAIRELRRRSDKWGRYPQRELEIRFSQAVKPFWLPLLRRRRRMIAIVDEIDAILARLDKRRQGQRNYYGELKRFIEFCDAVVTKSAPSD
jgi:hypothetical protein